MVEGHGGHVGSGQPHHRRVQGVEGLFLLGTTGGPRFLGDITLYQILGYNLLFVSAMIGLRLLYTIFRTERRSP